MPRPRLTPDEFQAWRAHPVTEIVHQYLRDLEALIREQWSQGENWTEQALFQVQNLEDLAGLDLNSIESFYEPKEDEHEQDSEDDDIR